MGKLLSVKESAAALGITEKCLRLWLSQGKVGFVKMGRLTKIPEQQVLELVARGHHRSTE
ncbi:MAG: helix-turn-helix domain-containing protein [Terriglobales bacterium]